MPVDVRPGVADDDLARPRRVALPVHRHPGAVRPPLAHLYQHRREDRAEPRAKLRILEIDADDSAHGALSGARASETTLGAASVTVLSGTGVSGSRAEPAAAAATDLRRRLLARRVHPAHRVQLREAPPHRALRDHHRADRRGREPGERIAAARNPKTGTPISLPSSAKISPIRARGRESVKFSHWVRPLFS